MLHPFFAFPMPIELARLSTWKIWSASWVAASILRKPSLLYVKGQLAGAISVTEHTKDSLLRTRFRWTMRVIDGSNFSIFALKVVLKLPLSNSECESCNRLPCLELSLFRVFKQCLWEDLFYLSCRGFEGIESCQFASMWGVKLLVNHFLDLYILVFLRHFGHAMRADIIGSKCKLFSLCGQGWADRSIDFSALNCVAHINFFVRI